MLEEHFGITGATVQDEPPGEQGLREPRGTDPAPLQCFVILRRCFDMRRAVRPAQAGTGPSAPRRRVPRSGFSCRGVVHAPHHRRPAAPASGPGRSLMVPQGPTHDAEAAGAPRDALEPEPHVLVVEDDGEVRQLVARLLRENGFAVSAARDGRGMREVMKHAAPPVDLVLLDVMLPGASGMDLLRELRAASPRLPVVMLTARGEETDRVLGLELGADDYVTKPFGRRELVARLRAVLRRAAGAESDNAAEPGSAGAGRPLRFAGWTLDTGRRELVSPAGAAVDLSGAEYDLLMAFLAHPQRVLGRDQLLEVGRRRVGDAFDRSVDVQVSRLRRKIEPGESAPPLIKTVRGAGYVFVAPVERG